MEHFSGFRQPLKILRSKAKYGSCFTYNTRKRSQAAPVQKSLFPPKSDACRLRYRNPFHVIWRTRYCVPSSTRCLPRLDTGQTQKTISHLWRVMKVDGTVFLGLLSRSDSRSVPITEPNPQQNGHCEPVHTLAWQSPPFVGKPTRPGPLGEAKTPIPLWHCTPQSLPCVKGGGKNL